METTAPPAALPGPPPMPLLGETGNHLRFFVDQLRSLEALSRFGPLVTLARGSTRNVFIFRPEYNMQVLSNPALFYSPEFWQQYPQGSSLRRLWTGLVTINGQRHKAHRRLLMPSFQKKAVESYRDEIVGFFQRMLDSWRPGDVRDVSEEMRRVALLIVTKVLFGIEDESEIVSMGSLLADWLDLFASAKTQLMKVDLPGMPFRRLQTLSRRAEAAIRTLIARRREQGAGGYDVLSTLLQARYEDGGVLSDDELVGQTTILFVAGHETTTYALTWTLFLLEQHPEVLANLVDALDGALHGAAPTVAQLEQVPLLERVVNESLRLIPPVPSLTRFGAEPFELGGHAFEAGTQLHYSPYITHRLPEVYPEPLRFLPERWEKAIPPYAFIPFSNGPRRCIGATLAMLELQVGLAMLLQRFRLQLARPRVDYRTAATLRPKGGLPMVVHAQDRKFARTPDLRGNLHRVVALS